MGLFDFIKQKEGQQTLLPQFRDGGMTKLPLPGATISSAPEQKKRLRDYLPDTLREGIFGREDAASLLAEKRDTGLLGFLFMSANKNETEKVMDRYDRVRKLGYDEKKALDFSVNDVRNVKQELPEDVDKAFFIPRFKENAGLALDIVGNVPAVGATKNVSKIIFKNIAQSTDKASILTNLKVLSPELSKSKELDTLATRLVDVTDPVKVQSLVDETLQSTLPKSPVTNVIGEEAKKYPTPEAFVKAQGKEIYHASDSEPFDVFDVSKAKKGERFFNPLGEGMYLSSNKDFVRRFGTNTFEYVLPKGAKVKTVTINSWAKSDYPTIIRGALKNLGIKYDELTLTEKVELNRQVPNTPIESLNNAEVIIRDIAERLGKTGSVQGAIEKVSNARNSAYDAIIFKDTDYYTDADEILIPDASKLHSKSQLTDIWKKANQSVAKRGITSDQATDPLYTEARKYKSAEEFVKAQTNAYHGTPNKEFAEFKFDTNSNTQNETRGLGVWVTPQEGAAVQFKDKFIEGFMGMGGGTKDVGGTVMPVHLKLKNPKVYTSTKGMDSILDKIKKIEEERPSLTRLHFTEDVNERQAIIQARKKADVEIDKLKREYRRDAFENFMDDRDKFATYIQKGARWEDRYIAEKVPETNKAFIEYLKKQGHDGILIKGTEYDANGTGHEVIDQIVSFDPQNVLTRSQLTDIWKKANETPKNIAKQTNIENSRQFVDEVRQGVHETKRLTNDSSLKQAKDYGALPKDVTPQTIVPVYRAGKGAITDGDFVTTVKEVAEKYLKERTGSTLQVADVPVASLVKTKGTGTEFVYAPKKLNQIDSGIAEGKVRVVSRDGKDVYQIKQGDKWVSKRDESSALKALDPKPKAPSKVVPIPQELEERLIGAQIAKEVLDANPLKQLSKYESKRGEFAGGLKEVTGKDGSKFSRLGDQLISSEEFKAYGIEDSEQAREQYLKYRQRVEDNEAELADIKLAIKQAKLEAKALQGESKAIAELVEPSYSQLPTTPEAIRTLEETANQLVEDLAPSLPEKPLTLEEIITQTPLKAKVNLLDYIRTPDRVLKKIGFEKEAKMLRDGYDRYIVELPKNIEKITKWYEKAPKGSGERIFKYLDGENIKLVPEEQQIATEIREYLKDWADRLKLPEDKRITNYITHIFDEELIAKEFDEDLAKLITDKVPGQVYDPFLEKRLGAKGYKQDVWQALDAYTKRATRKANMDEALTAMQDKAGSSLEYSNLEKSQFDYIQKYISRVNMRPTEIDNLLDTTFKQVFGYGLGQRPINRITSFMRRLTYRSFLGANIGSALRNLSQGVNTYAVLGERDLAAGYLKLFSPTNRAELEAQGIFANNFIQDRSINATRKLVEKADKGLWFLFDMAEKVNRGSAYLGAKTKGLRKGMSEQEAIDYAKSIVRKTQFSYDPVDAPVALSSDLVKTLLQFQTYTTKQTEFLTELAKDKNFAGLARYALGGLAFVYTIGEAFGMEPKELLPINTDTWSRFELAPSAKVPKEILKALINVPDEYGNERDEDEKIKDITDTLWGLVPAGSQIKKTTRGLDAVDEGGSYDSAGRKQFDIGGTPQKDIQAILFGKYANKEAKQYFDKETGDKTLDSLKEKDTEEKRKAKERLNTEMKTFKTLSKEEQKQRILELAREDEIFAEKVLDTFVEEKKGLTPTEKKLKESSIKVRAEYVHEKIKDLPKSEQKQIVEDYAQKGILTESVLDELITLMAESK